MGSPPPSNSDTVNNKSPFITMETEDDKRGLFNGIMSMPYQPKNYNTINEPIQITGMDLGEAWG
jgi:hypothetical protein